MADVYIPAPVEDTGATALQQGTWHAMDTGGATTAGDTTGAAISG